MATTGKRSRTPGTRTYLVSRLRTARLVIVGMSGGIRWVGAMSRWMENLIPGKVGGGSGYNREKWSVVEW